MDINPWPYLFSYLWFLFLIFFILMPLWRRYILSKAREGLIRELERKRGSRVITLIHRQESLGFFGIPLFRYIQYIPVPYRTNHGGKH